MGVDKALVAIQGRPFVRLVAAALEQVAERAIVTGRSEPLEGVPAIPDPPTAQRGSLAGLAAALEHAGKGHVLLIGVDQPFVRVQTLRHIADLRSTIPVVPIEGGIRQVTCGVYPAALSIQARDELERGGSIQSLLDRIPHRAVQPSVWRSWGEDGRSWFSVDTPELLTVGLDRYGSPI